MTAEKEIDAVTGVETTGHVWDGDLKELNKPLPRWWLYTLYACIVWAFGYWMFYPAWPMLDGYTKGYLGYSQRSEVSAELAASKAAQSRLLAAVATTPVAEIEKNPDLMEFVMRGGAAQFSNNCAPCHGRGAQGFKGYPNLNDDDWLWGGSIDMIEKTIRYGIRSDSAETHAMAMPRFGIDQMLDSNQISDAADFVCRCRSPAATPQPSTAAAPSSPSNAAAVTARRGRARSKWALPTSPTGSGSTEIVRPTSWRRSAPGAAA